MYTLSVSSIYIACLLYISKYKRSCKAFRDGLLYLFVLKESYLLLSFLFTYSQDIYFREDPMPKTFEIEDPRNYLYSVEDP